MSSLICSVTHGYNKWASCLVSKCLCFSVSFLNLISSFILLWPKKMLEAILIFLYLLRFILWPNMWAVLENVQYALDKYMYSAVFGWYVLKISIKSIWFNMLFNASIALLKFCLDDLGYLNALLVKNLPTVQETWVQSLHWEDPLEKGKTTHSSILAWRIPWTI